MGLIKDKDVLVFVHHVMKVYGRQEQKLQVILTSESPRQFHWNVYQCHGMHAI
jgi:hypothetical protein